MSIQSVTTKGNGNELSSEEPQSITNSDTGDESLGKKIREIRGLKGMDVEADCRDQQPEHQYAESDRKRKELTFHIHFTTTCDSHGCSNQRIL